MEHDREIEQLVNEFKMRIRRLNALIEEFQYILRNAIDDIITDIQHTLS